MDHTDLFQNGQMDLDSAKVLFDSELYGNSAFFLQQALEKHIKGFMLKNNVFENVKDLQHLPYVVIFEKYLELLKSPVEQTPELLFNPLIQLFENIIEFLKRLTKEEKLKIIIWKISLQIPLSDQEKSLTDGLDVQMEKKIQKLSSELPGFSKQYENYVQLNNLNKIDSSKLDKPSKESIDFLNKVGTSLSSPETSDFSIDHLKKFVSNNEYGTGKNSLSKDATQSLKNYISVLQTFDWSEMMIALFPHQTLSRYPENIDGKMTSELYVEYKENLHELMNQTETICKDIRNTN